VSTTARAPDREALYAALGRVYDPCCADRGVSILDMGVVERVHVEGADVRVDVVPTTGWCPFVASMSGAIEDGLREVEGVGSVDVRVVWEPAWTPDRLSEFARRTLSLPLEELEPHRQRRLAETRGVNT
jgi:metal-sulfur cluster biosynthetic enzyme